MKALLEHLYAALTTDTGLTALVDPNNIGATMRNPAEWPSVEFDIEGLETSTRGHIVTGLAIFIHSSTGAFECWDIHSALHKVMNPRTLTDAGTTGIRIASVRLTHARRLPRNEWAASLRFLYECHVASADYRTQNF